MAVIFTKIKKNGRHRAPIKTTKQTSVFYLFDCGGIKISLRTSKQFSSYYLFIFFNVCLFQDKFLSDGIS